VDSSLWQNTTPLGRMVVYVILIAVSVWVVLPFLWAVGNSFKDVVSTFSAGAFIPFVDYQPSLASWESVLGSPNALLALMNSFIASIGATIMVIILGTPAAYSLARFEFKIPSRDISIWFLSQRVLPPAVVLVPFFVVMVNLKLIDTRLALILVYTTFNLPFGVLIMRDIFRDISQDIEDAARIDGATEWQVFYRIALPLSVNGLITTGIIVFAFSWNEALFAATLTSREAATLPVYILSSRSTRGVDFNIAAVNTLLAIVPPVVMSLFVQRYLARGLSFGAVKG